MPDLERQVSTSTLATAAALALVQADTTAILARLPTQGITTVQYGSVVVPAATTTATATITSVDTTKSCVLYLGVQDQGGGASFDDSYGTLALTNATTVTFDRPTSTKALTVYFAVMTWTGTRSVQSGIITLSNVASNTATITAVTTAKSLLVWTGVWGVNAASPDRSLSSLALTNGTTVTATKFSATGIAKVSYAVIEFA